MSSLYPQELLPKTSYISPIKLDSLPDKEGIFLIRRASHEEELVLDDGETVRSHCFIDYSSNSHDFFNLSLNIVGIFKRVHLEFILDRSHGIWNEGDPIPELSEIKFSFQPGAKGIYLPMVCMIGCQFKYSKSDTKNNKVHYQGTCMVVHAPLNANYWHCEFQVLDTEGKAINRNKTKWKSSAVEDFIESYLKAYLSIQESGVPIGKEAYTTKYPRSS